MPERKFFAVFLLAVVLLAGCAGTNNTQQSGAEEKPVLRVYTYDSMVSEYGLGPKIVPKFEEECNCRVDMVSAGDAGQVLARLVLEKDNPKADVMIGLDNSLKPKAIEAGVLEKFTPPNIEIVPQELIFDAEGYITPFDFGFIAFVYDKNKISLAPKSFEDLLDERFREKIVIQNPRTSSPGLALLLWTIAVYGEDGYLGYWEKLEPNILTVTAGWDESAGMFAAGETPMYLSYATSPPYYVQFEEKDNFVAAHFTEGHYMQIEGIAIVKGTQKRKLAEEFIEFSLTEEFQEEIPLTQFMFPVNKSAELPASFEFALKPDKKLVLDGKLVSEKQEEWIFEWEKIFS
ncbi:MAG: thiamine ABC transporter substrate binding subunit [archaeon]|nr:thiamine ABC transporter substrate binding subunit [archaeon]